MIRGLFSGNNHHNGQLELLASVNELVGLGGADGCQVYQDRFRRYRVATFLQMRQVGAHAARKPGPVYYLEQWQRSV
jgi:hypothetical protein